MLIITLIVVVLFSSIAAVKYSEYGEGLEVVGVIGTIISSVCLMVCFVSIPLERMSTRAGVMQFEAVRSSRFIVDEAQIIEAAAWRMEVSKANKWLAGKKFYNGTVFDIWVPDEIEQVKPIE